MTNLKYFLFQIYLIGLFLIIIKPNLSSGAKKYTKEDLLKLREEVREMFNHAYSGYLKYAYPYDELRPLTCDGVDTWGSYSLTLIDALDTLAVMGNYSEFRRVVDIVVAKANFDANINVSVFETNIRIVGGLLSAHLLSQRAGVELEPGWPCNGPLLRLAEDVAKRLIAAFDTSTGMPYGTVNLRHGVPPGETSITCTAGVGTFILEFGSLSRLTGDPIYEEVALNALHSLYYHRSSIGLYGNHIDVQTGRWTAQDSGIGAGVDSYLEYLVKGALLVHRPELMAIFNEGRTAIDKHLKRNDWYLWVSMHKGQITLPVFQSLEAYWPGVLSLIGDISGGMKSMHNYHQVWKQYGFTPEFYNIAQGQVGTNRESYPLRPELIESTMYLYRATGDPFLLDVGTDILRSIQHSARTKCGYATIKDCRDHSLENRMESFFLAETTKYLYLLFDTDNFIHNNGRQGAVHTLPSGRECILDAGGYIFNTEAHPLDPAALLCCSENFDEPKRYSRKAAGGEKFTTFVKPDERNPNQKPDESNSIQSSLGDKQDQDRPTLPSALTDEEPFMHKREVFENKLHESGAVDIITVPPPSEGDDHSVGEQKKLSLNMIEIIEVLINTSIENQISRSAWSHDLLKELIEIIDHADKELNHSNNTDLEYNKSSINEQAQSKGNHSYTVDNAQRGDIEDPKISVIESVEGKQEHESDSFSESNIEEIKSPKQFSNANSKIPKQDSSTPEPKNLENKNKGKSLFELVIVQQFQTIRSTVLTETDILIIQLNTCLKNLELTKNLIEIVNDKELESQFITKKFEVMLLASTIKDSVDLTKNLLFSNEYEKGVTLESFKKLVEVVVESKIVKDFMDKYIKYLQFLKEIIAIGKSNYNANLNRVGNDEEVSAVSSDQNINNSEEENSSANEATENSFQENNWQSDDITYQVDDKERVVPVTKVDAGPFFTDKLTLKGESMVSLLPKSLVSGESPFNPQILLERIRANPKYPRNKTWTTQYDLLTCLPQPYFTRIMLSGEFYND